MIRNDYYESFFKVVFSLSSTVLECIFSLTLKLLVFRPISGGYINMPTNGRFTSFSSVFMR